ncbi:hypothetical protein L7F22_040994 [Adiantum nelumboides]|nr:hypothetical protein [Adiantum nelumboides]
MRGASRRAIASLFHRFSRSQASVTRNPSAVYASKLYIPCSLCRRPFNGLSFHSWRQFDEAGISLPFQSANQLLLSLETNAEVDDGSGSESQDTGTDWSSEEGNMSQDANLGEGSPEQGSNYSLEEAAGVGLSGEVKQRRGAKKATSDNAPGVDTRIEMLPRVMIVGRPNVGKSALFNRLTKRREALVYNTPQGHVTRDIREGVAKIGDLRFVICDTAGLETEADSNDVLIRTAGLTSVAFAQCHLALFLLDGSIVKRDRADAGAQSDEKGGTLNNDSVGWVRMEL